MKGLLRRDFVAHVGMLLASIASLFWGTLPTKTSPRPRGVLARRPPRNIPIWRRVTLDEFWGRNEECGEAIAFGRPTTWYGDHGWMRVDWEDIKKGWVLLSLENQTANPPKLNIFTAGSDSYVSDGVWTIELEDQEIDLLREREEEQQLKAMCAFAVVKASLLDFIWRTGDEPTRIYVAPQAIQYVVGACAGRLLGQPRLCSTVFGYEIFVDPDVVGYRFERV
jgi:hypothetical protein